MKLLRDIETGAVQLIPVRYNPRTKCFDLPNNEIEYIGNQAYLTTNKEYVIFVFIDAGYFDYIDSIETLTGNKIYSYGDDELIDEYRPNQKVEKERYHIKFFPYFAEMEYVDGKKNELAWCETDLKNLSFECKKCNTKLDFSSARTTTELSKMELKALEKHYDCNPIYGPQIVGKNNES